MDTHILLTTLPPWGVESPPIGLGYLDSYVRSKGLRSEVYDFNIYFHNTAPLEYKMLWHLENKNYWSNEKTFPVICKIFQEQINYAAQKIASSAAGLVGFSVVDPKERITIEVIKRVKRAAPAKKIILGGPACSTEQQRNFFTNNIPGQIDYFVVGEGEETLYEVIRRQQLGSDNKDIAGLACLQDGAWRSTVRAPINPLDKLSFPDYRNFDLSQYLAKEAMLVEWSRGCLGRCSFCKNYRLVQGYRWRSAKAVFEELKFLKENYGINNFTVCDNLMNGNIEQLGDICSLIIKNKLQINWSGQIAPRSQMQDSLFRQMRLAGCSKVQIGVESGSQVVLSMMRKPYSPEVAAENIKAAKRSGMETEIFLLVGFPGETEKEFRRTADFIKENSRFIDAIKSINTLHLIAGTDIYEDPSRFGLASLPERDWHYLWEAQDGNTYTQRKNRVEALLGLAASLGIPVRETNIKEGKEASFQAGQPEVTQVFKDSLSSVQELPRERAVLIKKRNALRWLLLIFSVSTLFLYLIYFWFAMLLRNRMILGGRKE